MVIFNTFCSQSHLFIFYLFLFVCFFKIYINPLRRDLRDAWLQDTQWISNTCCLQNFVVYFAFFLPSTSLLIQQFLEELQINQLHSKLLYWKQDSSHPQGKTQDQVRSHLYTHTQIHTSTFQTWFSIYLTRIYNKDAPLILWLLFVIQPAFDQISLCELPFVELTISETTLIFASLSYPHAMTGKWPC